MVEDITKLSFYKPPMPLGGNLYFFGRIGCLDEDTFIDVVEDNNIISKKIKDLPQKFKVLSYDFNKRYTKKNKIKINNAEKIYSGEQEVYEIEFTNGKKVIATNIHTFFDMNGNEIVVKDLKKYDRLFGSNRQLLNRNVSKREDIRRKLSISSSGKNNGMYGRKLTEEHKRRISESIRGEKNPSKRIEVREKISKNQWTKNKTHLEILSHYKNSKNPFNKGLHIWKNKEHPRGMLGKHHSEKVKNRIKNTNLNSGINIGKVNYPKLRYINYLGHSVRSSWEEKVCLKLKRNNIFYEYEPQFFGMCIDNKRCSYTPDIKISETFIEIKGPLFDWQIKKMKEFCKNNILYLITSHQNFTKLKEFNLINYYDFINEDFNINEFLLKIKK